MRRMGLILLDTGYGVIGEYIVFLLNNLRNCVDYMVVLCVGGELSKDEENKINPYIDQVAYSKKGNAFEALKEAITCSFINQINESDELVFCDDSFYGPFVSFSQIIETMNLSDADFWGITKRAERLKGEKIKREYLQKNILVFRKKILSSHSLEKFFLQKQAKEVMFKNKCDDFDYGMTWFLSDSGFSYEAYVKDDEINNDLEFNYNHAQSSPYLMLKKYKMPIIPRSTFSSKKNLVIGNGEEAGRALSYVNDVLNYSVDYIWDDLLRKEDITCIKDNLGLNIVVSDDSEYDLPDDKKILVVAHLYYEDLIEDCGQYLSQIPDDIDILVTSSKAEVLDCVQNLYGNSIHNTLTTKLISNRGRDVAAIFVECRDVVKDYDLLCFVHDKKTSGGRGYITKGASFHDMVWTNMLSSNGYVRNIVNLFESDNRLGLLVPPIPIHSGYDVLISDGWTVNYEISIKEAERMGLKVHFDKRCQPFGFSTCFWCRTKALEKIWTYNLKLEDFKEHGQKNDGEINHAIERLIIYVAQDAGYYSAIVENTYYASLIQQNLYIDLRDKLKKIEKNNKKKNKKRLKKYLDDKKRIFVYGAGLEGEKAKKIIEGMGYQIDAYIVSDNHFDCCKTKLSPIIRLSEANLENAGVVIAMNSFNKAEAKDNLKNIGYTEAIPLFKIKNKK